MAKSDRPTLLETLDERHDGLLEQLEALNREIEAALAAHGVVPQHAAGDQQRST